MAMTAVPAVAQELGKYFNADGSRTDNLDTAMQSWRDDPEFKGTWGFAAINAEAAFARGITGKGVTIGLLDSGTKVSHPEFKDKNIKVLSFTGAYADGTPFDIRGDDPKDGHGTKMAGLLGAARNGIPMMGLAYGADLVIGSTGLNDSHDLEFATRPYEYFKLVQEALVESGVRIISNSWGQSPGVTGSLNYLNGFYARAPKPSYLDAMADAANAGVIQVVAGYNERTANPAITPILPHYRPELEKNWVAVANLNAPEELGYSNKCGAAKYWCISAPGDGSTSTSLDDGYASAGGTSSATPHASATLALLMQRFPGLGNNEIRQIMLTTATDIGEAGADAKFGWGRIDIAKAMNGPAQFLSRFNANLGAGVSDTWSNDISQVALDQRQKEEKAEITAWAKRKGEKRWETGAPDPQKSETFIRLTERYMNVSPAAKKLLEDAIAANLPVGFSGQKLRAALASAEADPVASALLALYEKQHPDWTGPFSTATDYTNFLSAYKDERSLAMAIASADPSMAELIENASEYLSSESRTGYLSTKTYEAGLTKSGLGSLTLAGKNTYRGDTIIDGGELAIAEQASIISNAFVNDTGRFSVDGTAANVSVNKGGQLRVSGTGTTGDLVLNGGLASLDGSSGRVAVNSGGRLAGTGKLAELSANAGGAVAPGHSIGILRVDGDATFKPGSVYEVEVAGGGSDRIDAEGKAYLLGGIVSIRPEAGGKALSPSDLVALRDRPYTILTAGDGVTGMFDAVEPRYVFIGASLGYDAISVKATLGRNDVAFASLGSTYNERALLGGIDNSGFGNPLHDMIVVAENKEMPAAVALAINEGLIAPTLAGVLARDASAIGNAAQNRMRAAFNGVTVKEQATTAPLAFAPAQGTKTGDAFDAVTPPPATTALWGEAYGAFAHAAGDGNAAGYSRDTGGFVTGLDGVVAETWRMGVLAGYGNTSLDSGTSKASVDSYSVGLYGGTAWDNLRLSLGTALSQNEIDADRTAVFGDLVNRHSASYDAKSVQVFGELGYAVRSAYADFEPFAAASYVHLKTGGFQENGGISNLSGLGGTTDLTTTTLGLRASREFALSDRVSLTARGLLGWSHAFGDVTPAAKLAFAGGQPFDVKGLAVARDTGIVEAGFDFTLSPSKGISGNVTTLGLTYSGQFSESASNNALKADLTVRF
ncbi:autotransporter domain-containing protein [Phyllobacterium endophyticum]|nr:autotransporter serine protease [Phyllobacterium endophyticum]MBB3238030.1 subtilase-type serine protease [Phyllobacterium endophyticum]